MSSNESASQKLSDLKDKYGFIPTSVFEMLGDDELDKFVGEVYDNADPVLVEEFKECLKEYIIQSVSSMESEYGRVPKSIDDFKSSKELKAFIDDTSIVKRVADNGGVGKARGGGFAKSYNYSTFNPALAEFLLKHYFQEDMTIFDPFSGTATRGLMANKNKIHYHGWDVSPMTTRINDNKIYELQEEQHPFLNKPYDIVYNLGDGTKLDGVPDNFYDGALTCPPHYNIEKYESVDGQLSDYKKYEDFYAHYAQGFKRFHDVIKTSDIKNKVFYPLVVVTFNIRVGGFIKDFTNDTRKAAEAAGFKLYDEMHRYNVSPFVYLRARQNEANKMVAKVHETVSVFLKV